MSSAEIPNKDCKVTVVFEHFHLALEKDEGTGKYAKYWNNKHILYMQ